MVALVATDCILGPMKSKIFIICPLQKKVVNPCLTGGHQLPDLQGQAGLGCVSV
jgi:hypothetical protein